MVLVVCTSAGAERLGKIEIILCRNDSHSLAAVANSFVSPSLPLSMMLSYFLKAYRRLTRKVAEMVCVLLAMSVNWPEKFPSKNSPAVLAKLVMVTCIGVG